MDTERIREIEAKIDDLRRRMPKHSVPPAMARELEDLEDELDEILAAEAGVTDAAAAEGRPVDAEAADGGDGHGR